MKSTEKDYIYLTGKKSSNGYFMKLENNRLYSRTEKLLEILGGGYVIHIGCCDHLPLIQEKIKSHAWLHGLLDECCAYVCGIDINPKAVEHVNSNKYAKHNVICADITSSNLSNIFQKKFDYVLLGEILEHVDNPVTFLTKMKRNFSKYGFDGKYIITVPNAFCFQKNQYLKGIEGINTDHRYWFTPYTISKVMYRSDIYPEEIIFVDYETGLNGSSKYTNLFFKAYKKLFKKPSSYKSYRGGQMIVVGK